MRAVDRLKLGDLAIDCGCNQGWVTSALAATGPTVYSFDPEPSVTSKMDALCAKYPNVKYERKAVGPQNCRATMYRHESFETDPQLYSLSSSMFSDKRHASGETAFEVDVVGLPDFIRRLGRPVSLLKLDVEGAEVAILHALLDEKLMDDIALVFTEMHEDRIPSLISESDRLRTRLTDSPYASRVFLDWE